MIYNHTYEQMPQSVSENRNKQLKVQLLDFLRSFQPHLMAFISRWSLVRVSEDEVFINRYTHNW